MFCSKFTRQPIQSLKSQILNNAHMGGLQRQAPWQKEARTEHTSQTLTQFSGGPSSSWEKAEEKNKGEQSIHKSKSSVRENSFYT